MPPKRKAKAATADTAPPAAPKVTPKVQKHGPSNVDENATKPTAKKARKGKNVPADDVEEAGNEQGGTAKVVRKARAKKTRRVTPHSSLPHPTDCSSTPTGKPVPRRLLRSPPPVSPTPTICTSTYPCPLFF